MDPTTPRRGSAHAWIRSNILGLVAIFIALSGTAVAANMADQPGAHPAKKKKKVKRGPAGPKGDQGDVGPQGPPGDDGPPFTGGTVTHIVATNELGSLVAENGSVEAKYNVTAGGALFTGGGLVYANNGDTAKMQLAANGDTEFYRDIDISTPEPNRTKDWFRWFGSDEAEGTVGKLTEYMRLNDDVTPDLYIRGSYMSPQSSLAVMMPSGDPSLGPGDVVATFTEPSLETRGALRSTARFHDDDPRVLRTLTEVYETLMWRVLDPSLDAYARSGVVHDGLRAALVEGRLTLERLPRTPWPFDDEPEASEHAGDTIGTDASAAVDAIKGGAKEYIPLPPDATLIAAVLAAVADESNQMVFEDKAMANVIALAEQVAPSEASILITGESGTGKEVIARHVHRKSNRADKQFISINCAAIPDNLLESELFGHEKGAFTGAIAQRKGRFEQAAGGTVFLDEVGEIPLAMQVKLLRVLQERRFERVGGAESIGADVRVIAATNRSLERMVRKGKFREDLYYRVNVVRLELPPLRDRPEDIPILARHFCEKYARPGEPPKEVAPEAMEVLINYAWPGNVRELENVIERACVTCRNPTISKEHLGPELLLARQVRTPVRIAFCDSLEPSVATRMCLYMPTPDEWTLPEDATAAQPRLDLRQTLPRGLVDDGANMTKGGTRVQAHPDSHRRLEARERLRPGRRAAREEARPPAVDADHRDRPSRRPRGRQHRRERPRHAPHHRGMPAEPEPKSGLEARPDRGAAGRAPGSAEDHLARPRRVQRRDRRPHRQPVLLRAAGRGGADLVRGPRGPTVRDFARCLRAAANRARRAWQAAQGAQAAAARPAPHERGGSRRHRAGAGQPAAARRRPAGRFLRELLHRERRDRAPVPRTQGDRRCLARDPARRRQHPLHHAAAAETKGTKVNRDRYTLSGFR